MTFLQSLFIYLYPKKFQLSLWTFGQSSRKCLLFVNGQCSNIIMYVLSIRSGFIWEKICLEILWPVFFLFFLPVCKRTILIVLWFIWKTEWRLLNCRNKFNPNYSTIYFACGYVYWKRAKSVFFAWILHGLFHQYYYYFFLIAHFFHENSQWPSYPSSHLHPPLTGHNRWNKTTV